MFFDAKWIGRDKNWKRHSMADYLACNFPANKEKYDKFTLKISAKGLFKVSINGKEISDTFFDPGESNWGKRTYYAEYNITDFITNGENAIGIILGNGQYTNFIVNPTMEKDGDLIEPHRYQKNDGDVFCEGIYGVKKAIAVIDGDGEKILVSDENWKITNGPIVFQNWYGGEDYDATREIENWDTPLCDRNSWDRVYAEENTVFLTKRFFNPVKIIEEIKPVEIIKNNDSYIIDFGKNGAGFVKMCLKTTPEQKGKRIQIFPTEELGKDGFSDQRSCTQSWSETKKCSISDNYIIKGTGREEWHPIFCYHGFRYAEIKGFCGEIKDDTFTYCRLMASNKKTGFFETDNEILMSISDMTDRSIESNMFFAFTDCPQIEKLGWLETSHLMFRSMAYGWDINSWGKKIALDISDSVFPDGYVPAIVPEFQRIRGLFRDVNWGGACIMMPLYHYEHYKDKAILEALRETEKKYIDHLFGYVKDGVLSGYSQMGDWGQINENTPTILVENCAFYLLLVSYAKILDILGSGEESKGYKMRANALKKAFHQNEECYNKESKVYGNGSQSSYGCVLFSGIVLEGNEESAIKGLLEAIERADYHLTSGEVGLKQVFATLNKYGYDDVVYKMVTNPTPPGYRYFVDKKLTTLPEYWNYEDLWWGMVRSRNHAMMGHIKEWLTRAILGIRYENIENITISPFVPENTTYAKGKISCGYGDIEVFWRIVGDRKMEISVKKPDEIKVKVYPPKGYELDEKW